MIDMKKYIYSLPRSHRSNIPVFKLLSLRRAQYPMNSVPPWSHFNSFAFYVRHKGPIWTGLHLGNYVAMKDRERYAECLLNSTWNSRPDGSFLASLLWLHLPIAVEALFSIVSTESLLMATGRQLTGGAVQLPFDLGWRWGVKHHCNQKRDEGGAERGQPINREHDASFCKPCN